MAISERHDSRRSRVEFCLSGNRNVIHAGPGGWLRVGDAVELERDSIG